MQTIKTETRTDKLGRKSTWYVLADGRAYRSEKQARNAKQPVAKKAKKIAAKAVEQAARVMSKEEAILFHLAYVACEDTLAQSIEYAKAMRKYMLTGQETDDVRGVLNRRYFKAVKRAEEGYEY